MAVLITDHQKVPRISQEAVRKTAQRLLDALASPDGELSVLIVDDAEIAEYNRTYLNREGPTNVIAFPMREGDFTELTPYLLGDVVISAETARREAEAADLTTEERFDQLLVHGILHLFGYDHEQDSADAGRMEGKSGELLALIRESRRKD